MRYYGLIDADSAFDKYFLEGGMAGAYLYSDEESKYKYIKEIYTKERKHFR